MFEFLQFFCSFKLFAADIPKKKNDYACKLEGNFMQRTIEWSSLEKVSGKMQNFPVKNYTSLFDTKVGDQKSFEFVVWHEFKSQFNRYVQ